jgi:hypothetical protein
MISPGPGVLSIHPDSPDYYTGSVRRAACAGHAAFTEPPTCWLASASSSTGLRCGGERVGIGPLARASVAPSTLSCGGARGKPGRDAPLAAHVGRRGCWVLEMSPPPSGSKAPARGGTTRLRPTVVSVTKEDSMNKTLPEFSALLAAEHIADLRREATAERKARAARAARRQRRA